MIANREHSWDPELLFFILIFLLLFYDSSALEAAGKHFGKGTGDSTILFFILIFLKLFY